jgi:hypothetical protein
MATLTPGRHVFLGAAGAATFPKTTLAPSISYRAKAVGQPLHLNGGTYKVTGHTVKDGGPVARRVYLCHQGHPELPIAATLTRGDSGYFEFLYLPNGMYTVYGVNEDGTENNVIFAHIPAVSM